MKKMKLLWCILGCAILTASIILVISCASNGGGETANVVSYGGSDPSGDYIVILLDRDNSRVKHINYTEGETEETQPWYDYEPLPASDDLAQGFSIIYKVVIDGTHFVLFAEFPDVALIYQVFTTESGSPETEENPAFAVLRESVDSSSYYENAYTWMKFFIDETTAGANSDMSAGFASFDSASEQGLLYGSSYSKREDQEDGGFSGSGVGDINEGDSTMVDSFTYDADTVSNIIWTTTEGDWDHAITMTGTASGAVILDFGPAEDGGMGLAIPQTDLIDDATSWWSSASGTYFTMVYEYDLSTLNEEISPMKMVITPGGFIKVFQYEDSTETGTPVFNKELIALKDFPSGPNAGEPIRLTFQTVSGNVSANATTVQNAHLCKGAFISEDVVEDQIVTSIFDPSGRFFGFTMFDNEGIDYILRFGFGIKDENYNNPTP